jgi:enterobacterial common antigen flippase
MNMLHRSLHAGLAQRAVLGSVGAGLAGQAALLVSGVVFARLLGPQGRGDLALLLLLPAVVYQIGNLGLPVACAYYVAQDTNRSAAIALQLRLFASIQAVGLVVIHAVVIAIVIWPRGSSVQAAALISLAWTPALAMQEYGLAFLQGERRFFSFNVLRQIPAYINALVAVGILLIHGHDVTPVIAMLVIANAILGAATLVFALRPSQGAPSHSQRAHSQRITLRKLISFGVKGMLGSSYPVETFRLDQLIVGLFLSTSDLGLYVVALSFINLPRIVSQSVGFVAYPQIAAERDKARQRLAIWRFFWVTTGITVVIVLGLELVLPTLVTLFFGSQFAAAVPVARVLLVAAILLSARRILSEVIKGAGNPAAGSIAELVSFAALLPAFVVFTRSLHLVGVGVALTASAALSLTLLIILDIAAGKRPALTLSDVEATVLEEPQGSDVGPSVSGGRY